MNLGLIWESAWKVLAVGMLLGAGLPGVFALGVRAMAYGLAGDAEEDPNARPHPIGRALGILCFALVALAVLSGIAIIVASGFGKQVSFEHIYPTIVSKG